MPLIEPLGELDPLIFPLELGELEELAVDDLLDELELDELELDELELDELELDDLLDELVLPRLDEVAIYCVSNNTSF